VLETPLGELYGCDLHRDFSAQKAAAHGACGDCRWWSVCHGGCVKDRIYLGDGPATRTPLCAGLRRFFDRAMPEFDRLADRIRRTVQKREAARRSTGPRRPPVPGA